MAISVIAVIVVVAVVAIAVVASRPVGVEADVPASNPEVGDPCATAEGDGRSTAAATRSAGCLPRASAHAVGTRQVVEHGRERPVAAVGLTIGGDQQAEDMVLVSADVSVQTTDPVHCPCHVSIRLVDATRGRATSAVEGELGSVGNELRGASTSLSSTALFPVGALGRRTFEVHGYLFDRDVAVVDFRARISAVLLAGG